MGHCCSVTHTLTLCFLPCFSSLFISLLYLGRGNHHGQQFYQHLAWLNIVSDLGQSTSVSIKDQVEMLFREWCPLKLLSVNIKLNMFWIQPRCGENNLSGSTHTLFLWKVCWSYSLMSSGTLQEWTVSGAITAFLVIYCPLFHCICHPYD